jgi:prophage regulatory protein
MTNPTTKITLLRLDDVKNQTGLGRSIIYKMIGEGQFPSPVKITSKSVAWPSNEVDEWITSKINDRNLLH